MNAYDNLQADDSPIRNPVPHYVERYGLSCAPFSSQHEDRFVYLDAERLQRLNMLEHLSRYSELLLIITGPKGIGKTSLLQHFVLNIDEDTVVGQIDANPMMDADKLLQAIASGFGLRSPASDPVALQDALYHHLAALHHQEKVPLLVIDDAHTLPQDALETLFNLANAETSDDNLLRIILFSDPQIETMLQSPAIQRLRERVTHSMSIPPLDEEQTVGYIRHRMTVAGLAGALPFSSKELHKIFRNSAGIPARINECAHLILNGDKLDQAVRDFHTPRVKFPRLKFPAFRLPESLKRLRTQLSIGQVLGAAIVFIVIGLGLAYQDAINALFETEPPQQAADATASPAPLPQPVPEPVSTETTRAQNTPAEETPTTSPEPPDTPDRLAMPAATDEKKTATAIPAPTTRSINAEPQKEPAGTESKPAAEPAPPALRIADISPDPVTASRQPQTIAILGEHFSKDMNVTVYWTGGQKTLSPRQVRVISPNEMELHITVGRKADNWKVRLQDPLSKHKAEAAFRVTAVAKKDKPASSTTPSRSASPGKGLNGEDWIARQTPQHFTLQLLGSHQKDSLQKFVTQHQLQNDVAGFTSLRNNRPWYVLIQGRYASRAEAEKASRVVRKNIPGIKPWIRPFADIQKILQQQAITPPPAAISRTPAPTPPPGSDRASRAAWIWSQDPSHYTLQLLGGQTEAGIQRFIRQHKLGGKALYYRTTRNGQPWFVLIYNSYPSHARARAAISDLPESLRKTRPWPRSFASIHAEL